MTLPRLRSHDGDKDSMTLQDRAEGTSLVYTSLLVAGSKYDHEDKACSLSLLGLTSSPSAFLFVILFYLVPLSAMLIVYPLIVHRLLTNKMNIPAQRVKANKRISTLLIFSTVAFALLWAPLMVPSLWHAVDSQSFNSFFSQHSRLFQIHAVCNLFIILYSVVNPCIYAMITRPIREPLLQELQNQTQDLIIRRLSCQPPGVMAAAASHNQVHSGSKKTEETPA